MVALMMRMSRQTAERATPLVSRPFGAVGIGSTQPGRDCRRLAGGHGVTHADSRTRQSTPRHPARLRRRDSRARAG